MSEETALQREFYLRGDRSVMVKEKALSESEAIKLVQKGDKEAYQVIVERYMKRAYYIVLGFVRNSQDALDLSQESFIKAFRKIKRFDPERPFFPWFYKLLKNICLDHIKRKNRAQEIPLDEIRVFKEEKEDKEMKEILWKGIESLPFEQREVVLLHLQAGRTFRQIAHAKQAPIGTVQSRYRYGLEKLKALLINEAEK